ncbi:helix-turn-helix transcriptional regulator [Chryseobacterium sp.]|uniref:helix-turn-helix domain-containing protein n=1 Tax=Chryseobacterium sp. TaxID=1871047 RepID=UPI00289E5740|nr:helix-turn-helix transcriptional regulator [Chryseobacterium sp.]
MIHEKLKNLRKQKGISQETIAKILCTDTSNYSRKERGETKIHDEEWQKLAKALDVNVEIIKDDNNFSLNTENYILSIDSVNYLNHNCIIPNSIIENLQDYIIVLKNQVRDLKEENEILRSQIIK